MDKIKNNFELNLEKENNFESRKVLAESSGLKIINPDFDDLEKMLEWRNEKSFINGCTHRDSNISMDEFYKELEEDYLFDRKDQVQVLHKKLKELIGTLWSYKWNKKEKSIYITTYINKKFQKKSIGPDAFSLYLKYLFEEKDIEKVYTEVYGNNELSLKTMLSGGFEIIENDEKSRIKKGEKTDLIKLVFDKNNEEQNESLKRILEIFK